MHLDHKSLALLVGRILLVLPLLAFTFVAADPGPKVSTRTRSGQVSTARNHEKFSWGVYLHTAHPKFAVSSSGFDIPRGGSDVAFLFLFCCIACILVTDFPFLRLPL